MVDRHAVRLSVATFLTMLAAACSSGGLSGPSLRPAGNPNPSMAGLPNVSPAHHALIGEMLLCLTQPGRDIITAVRPIHPTGTIDVLRYAVRPNPFLTGGEMLGTVYGTLRTHGFTADRAVDAACGAVGSGKGYELGLELSVPPGTNAGTTGWEIDYRTGDRTASTTFPYGAVLCSTPNIDDKPCKHVWQRFGVHW